MICFDCDQPESAAVALCGRCGVALCREHAIVSEEQLMIRVPIAMQVPAAAPARRVRCGTCAAAERAHQKRDMIPSG